MHEAELLVVVLIFVSQGLLLEAEPILMPAGKEIIQQLIRNRSTQIYLFYHKAMRYTILETNV